jgi:hypothetical protein
MNGALGRRRRAWVRTAAVTLLTRPEIRYTVTPSIVTNDAGRRTM